MRRQGTVCVTGTAGVVAARVVRELQETVLDTVANLQRWGHLRA